ncbi:MAG: TIR domain-containing protein [Desulfococcaceae bacterium]
MKNNIDELLKCVYEDEDRNINKIIDRCCEKVANIPAYIQLMKGYVNSECKGKDKIISYLDSIDINIKKVLKLRMPEFVDIECQISSILGQFREVDLSLFNFISELSSSYDCNVKTLFFDAVYEIIKNAVNSISGKGKIDVQLNTICKNNTKYIKISISDTGCGIPKDKHNSIFDPGTTYWANSKCAGSKGIGLWKACHIIQKLDGYIGVQSKIGKGSTFIIEVPLRQDNFICKNIKTQKGKRQKKKKEIHVMQNETIQIKVFISYANEDYQIAKRLYDHFKKCTGIVPWLDREDLLPGQNWRETIPRIIRESSYFLLLISKNSVSKKGFVQKEQKIALELLDEFPSDEFFIIPARLDNTEPIDEKLRNLHWADLSDYEKGFQQILKSLQK